MSALEPDIHCDHCTDGCVRCDPRKQDEYHWIPVTGDGVLSLLERELRAAERTGQHEYAARVRAKIAARVREAAP